MGANTWFASFSPTSLDVTKHMMLNKIGLKHKCENWEKVQSEAAMLELMEMMRGGEVGQHQSKVVRSWETWLRNKLRERFGLVLFSIHPHCTRRAIRMFAVLPLQDRKPARSVQC